MIPGIGSQPGANKFRSLFVVVLVLVCILTFLRYSSDWQKVAEEAGRDRTLTQLNSALALTLYKLTMQRQLYHLQELERINPFVYLAEYQGLPSNYHGTVTAPEQAEVAGWYFDLSAQQVYFIDNDGARETFAVEFAYEDKDGSGGFNAGIDRIKSLSIQKSPG